MEIYIKKDTLPVLRTLILDAKSKENYDISNYDYKNNILTAPNDEIDLETIISVAKLGVTVKSYPYFYEIPNADLGNNIPTGITFSEFEDESGNTINRTWGDTDLGASATGVTNTIRYWQAANNGTFVHQDVTTIQETYDVFGIGDYKVKRNEDYSDTGATEYNRLQTIETIDVNWSYGYFDIVHAYLNMTEIYEARGVDDDGRWDASTDVEKEILVRWNIVTLAKANQLLPSGWTETKKFVEISKKYKEFEANTEHALNIRFNDWYRFLRTILSASGTVKFKVDWDWTLKHEYVENYLREFEIGDTNELLNWHDTVLSTYSNADFIGSIPATTIINELRDILTDKKYKI